MNLDNGAATPNPAAAIKLKRIPFLSVVIVIPFFIAERLDCYNHDYIIPKDGFRY